MAYDFQIDGRVAGREGHAFRLRRDGALVVDASATPLSLFISGVVPYTITPWLTSDSASIVSQTPITVSNARFSASLDAQSVTTLVGKP